MKKILLLLIVSLVIITGCNQSDTSSYLKESTPISKFQSIADYEIPSNLNDLKNGSTYVVKVKALHELGDDVIDGQVFGSKKKVEIINSYMQDIENDEIVVIEPAHVQDEEYVSTESYIKMIDGEEYILFLFEGDNENEYGIAALGFGKYSLERDAEYAEITSFNTFSDLNEFDFLSNNVEEVTLYEVIKAEILKEFN